MIKSNFRTWENENTDDWKIGLVTDNYIFYCKFEESDENGNTKMYDRKMKLLSDNYFANQALIEEMENIYHKQTVVYYMCPEIAMEIHIREEEGEFE